MGIADERHVRVTTFGAGGDAVASTEWIVGLADARLACWTPDATGWPARLAASPVVTIQAAGPTGAVRREAPLLEGRAELVTEGPALAEARELTMKKYAVAAPAAGLLDSARELGGTRTPEGAVVITVVG